MPAAPLTTPLSTSVLTGERVDRDGIRLDLNARNALNTTYRDYLSRFKAFANAPGINIVFKASAGIW